MRWFDLTLLGVLLTLVGAFPRPVAAQTCIEPPYLDTSDGDLLSLLERTLSAVSRFPSLQDALEQIGPTICLSDTPSEAMGFFEPVSNRIEIDAALTADLQVAILLHEMRHVEQHQRGLCPHIRLSMTEYARARFALEADATAISLVVTWEMRENGEAGPWTALAALPHYAETAAIFDAQMRESGDPAEASAVAFTSWYDHEDRRHAYYISSCNAYLDEQELRHSIPRYETLDPAFFSELCVLPDGEPFACPEPNDPLGRQ